MKAILIALSLFLMPSVAFGQTTDKVFRSLLVGAVAAHGMDLSITASCLGAQTCKEANPILRPVADKSHVALGGVKMALAGVSLWTIAEVHRVHPKWGKVLLVASIVGYSYVAISNARRVQ